LSRIDEDFQAKQWGRDAEAEAVAAALRDELEASTRLFALLRQADS
jgi:chaperone required for assembly of F1-ATPase